MKGGPSDATRTALTICSSSRRADVGAAVARGDRLSLFGDAQATAQGLAGLRADREVRRTAAAADGAAAAVEDGEHHAGFVCDLREGALRPTKRDCARDVADLLSAVGVADHDFELASEGRPERRER